MNNEKYPWKKLPLDKLIGILFILLIIVKQKHDKKTFPKSLKLIFPILELFMNSVIFIFPPVKNIVIEINK